MEEKLNALKEHLQEVSDLSQAGSILYWDQSTYLPPGGAAARGRQLATLSQLSQEKFIAPEIGRLLDELQPYAESLPEDSDDARLIRVTRREYERAVKVPPAFVARFSAHTSEAYHVWAAARPEDDFAAVVPFLEKTVEYSREYANFFPGYDHIADPLINGADYGMKAESVRELFAELRATQVPIVEAITRHDPADNSMLKRHFPEEQQRAFGEQIIRAYGYDFQRGRQDKTHHPFMIRLGPDDVRITTRFKENDLTEGLFSTLHEAGHALYELGTDSALSGTPLASGTSAGVHESQSRLWENLVGRSRGFWTHYYPQLQETFSEQLGDVALDDFYRAINRVSPSLIRTDADELTYNLHVMIRFDLELDLLEGNLAVTDLPGAWNARYEQDLGVKPPNHRDGVLQDVHWFSGPVGGSFQGYTLGNVMSALFFEHALAAHPEIPEQIARGDFETLLSWLRENIYRHGTKFTANELVERISGEPLSIEPYIRYLRDKYGALYELGERMILTIDVEEMVDFLVGLLETPSPTGDTDRAMAYLQEAWADLPFPLTLNPKGFLAGTWTGEQSDAPRAVTAHTDTLGGMVQEIKENGRLRLTQLGGWVWNSVEGEAVTIFAGNGEQFRGTILPTSASIHAHTREESYAKRSQKNMEVRIDARTTSIKETRELGIGVGDVVVFDPRVEEMDGFIRSRHLDDKAGVAAIYGAVHALDRAGLRPRQSATIHISNYEEVGHGAAAGFPSDLVDLLTVDMAVVAPDQQSDEFSVTICAKDTAGPYHMVFRRELEKLARKNGIPYRVDVYPYYGSDGESYWRAGGNVRVGLIGPGVDASHHYERTHRDALEHTAQLIAAYLVS